MQRSRRELLAGAALAGEKNRRLRPGETLDTREERVHRRRTADEIDQLIALADLRREAAVLALEPPPRQRPVDRQAQRLRFERLRQIVVGAGADRFDGARDGAVGGDHDEADVGILAAHAGEELPTVAVRQPPVGDDEIDRRAAELARRRGERIGLGDAVALGREQSGEELALVGLVLDDQQALVVHRPASAGCRRSPTSSVTRVPVPAARGSSRSTPP